MQMQENACLRLTLTVSGVPMTRQDRRMTDDLRSREGTKRVAAVKKLWPEDATAELQSARAALYSAFGKLGCGWAGTSRVINAGQNDLFHEKIDPFVAAYHEEVCKFADRLPEFVEGARRALNGAFTEGDYPSQDEVRTTAKAVIFKEPLAETRDFDRLSTMLGHSMETVRQEHQAQREEFKRTALRDAYRNVISALQRVNGTLKSEPKRIYESLVGNVREALDLLPLANLFGSDPEFDGLVQQVRDDIASIDVESLKGNINEQKRVSGVAGALVARFDATIRRRIEK